MKKPVRDKLTFSMPMAMVLWLSWSIPIWATDDVTPTYRLNLSKSYPMDAWKGEVSPILHRTESGQIALFQSNGSIGKTPHAMISDDQGKTWRKWDAFAAWPQMAYADIVRNGNELLAFGFRDKDCYQGTYVWWSKDEGLTWNGGKRLVSDIDRWAPMNNRVLATRRGRLIVPIEQLLGSEGPDPNQLGTIYSDNGGRSWKRSPIFGPPSHLPSKPEGFGEPSIVELSDGRIWMVFRTRFGHLWQAWSFDGGASWSDPSPTDLISPLSAVNAKRIPDSDAVILFWNNAEPGTSPNWGDYPNLWTPRSPLVFAISRDDCKTWSRPVVVESGTAAYPSICFSGNQMLVAYWADPNPRAIYLSPKSDLNLVAYDVPSLLLHARVADIPTPLAQPHHERAIAAMRETLHKGQRFAKVHAAEYLLSLGCGDGVQEIFSCELQSHGAEPEYRIGIWRVLARAAKDDRQCDEWMRKIRDVLFDPKSPDQACAAETLAKRRYRVPDSEIHAVEEIAKTATNTMIAYVSCILANAGRPHAEARLAELLTSPDAEVRLTAAYSMRHLPSLSSAAKQKLQAAAQREPRSSTARIYMVQALAVHLLPNVDPKVKAELAEFVLHGKSDDKVDACQVFAMIADRSDWPLLNQLLEDPNPDLRATAGYAILRSEIRP